MQAEQTVTLEAQNAIQAQMNTVEAQTYALCPDPALIEQYKQYR
jgi:hypothetical protein